MVEAAQASAYSSGTAPVSASNSSKNASPTARASRTDNPEKSSRSMAGRQSYAFPRKSPAKQRAWSRASHSVRAVT